MMDKIKYRRAKLDDLSALCVIEAASFTSDLLSKGAFRRAITAKSQWLWVATSTADVPIGYLLLHYRDRAANARVYSLAVIDAWRGKGIASHLLRLAIARAKDLGRTRLTLEARQNNASLFTLYMRHGFTPLRSLPRYYQDGGDAVQMHLALTSDQTASQNAGIIRSAVRYLVVVPRVQDLGFLSESLSKRRSVALITAQQYLSETFSQDNKLTVINLCPSEEYLSSGYYVSLVAEARGSQPHPLIETLSNLQMKRSYEDHLAELNRLLPEHKIMGEEFGHSGAKPLSLEFYFGKTDQIWARKLAKRCYQLFPVPIVEIMIMNDGDKWKIDYVWPLSVSALDVKDRPRFSEALNDAIGLSAPSIRNEKRSHFDLAILVDPDEALPPSNANALDLMVKAARRYDMDAELIVKSDLKRLASFDGLFIRATTSIDHFTYQFARKAKSIAIPVIDDPQSILRCSNKVFLSEALVRAGFATPNTKLITRSNLHAVLQEVAFPQVLKIPDGSFSRGVIRVNDEAEFMDKAKQMLKESFVIIAQEYLPTAFDWRVGVINGEPLFACKYFMARGHWQIYNHVQNKKVVSGGFETVAIEDVPPFVIEAAVGAGLTIGNGLYGVDLKQIDRRAIVIEVNDNPNIDAGIEDKVYGRAVYDRLMQRFLSQILASKGFAT